VPAEDLKFLGGLEFDVMRRSGDRQGTPVLPLPYL
jgi:hypothetical protein